MQEAVDAWDTLEQIGKLPERQTDYRCQPVPMRECFTGHQFIAVSDRGWKRIKNGELLRLAEGQFDLFLPSA
jgi:hypothetical protein